MITERVEEITTAHEEQNAIAKPHLTVGRGRSTMIAISKRRQDERNDRDIADARGASSEPVDDGERKKIARSPARCRPMLEDGQLLSPAAPPASYAPRGRKYAVDGRAEDAKYGLASFGIQWRPLTTPGIAPRATRRRRLHSRHAMLRAIHLDKPGEGREYPAALAQYRHCAHRLDADTRDYLRKSITRARLSRDDARRASTGLAIADSRRARLTSLSFAENSYDYEAATCKITS